MRFYYTLALFFLGWSLCAQQPNGNVVSERLNRQLEEQDGYHDVFVILADRVDVQAMDEDFYQRKASLEERTFELITALKSKANATQYVLLDWLNNANGVDKSSIRSYWITNMIFFSADKKCIADFSYHDAVAWMDLNVQLEITEYEKRQDLNPMPVVPGGIEPGLAAINAPAMWALGYTGYGRVAMVHDTGADPVHPSYLFNYRGIYVPDEEAWYQYNSENVEPFDCSGHGSHVLGTMLGLDRNTADTIGVAFNSLWLGSPGIVCAYRGTEATVGAFQWALDPDGNPLTITDMPDVINNSWHDPDDDNECEGSYVDVLTALEAAGVAVVFSAGNEGPDPESATPPHNVNTSLVNTFAVGALNANNPNLNIAGFSSRGPSICGGAGSLLIKPEVSAPGVNVRSAGLGGTYEFNSGTSMAAPHVSGSVLLLKEAFPYLTGAELKLALYHTCTDLGEPGEDNTYGMGIIDVLAAFNYLVDLGNIPVDPSVERDLVLTDAVIDDYYCKGEAYSNITVENAGTLNVHSFDVFYEVEGSSYISGELTWTGSLAAGENVDIDIPPLPVMSGIYTYRISIRNPDGEPEERPLNNDFKKKITSIEDFDFEVYADQLEDYAACTGSGVLIRADHQQNATVSWYDSEDSSVPLANGNDFYIENMDSTATYYAGMTLHASTGLQEPDELEFFEEIGGGIVFDCYAPFVLRSATIYPQSTGIAIVSVKTSDGMGLVSKTLLISETGKQEVLLGLKIPKGLGLVLEIEDGISFSHTNGPIAYPFEVPSVLSINGSNDSVAPEEGYYYFYDWKIDYEKFCGRIPVTTEVVESDAPPQAGFAVSSNYLDLDISGDIGFTDLSTQATAWHWNFDDGSGSILSGPSHIYTDTGTFIVSQTVLGLEGCSDTAIDTVRVAGTLVGIADPGISEDLISVFPVPVRNELNIRFEFHKSRDIRIRIFDVLGRTRMKLNQKAYYNETKRMDLGDLGRGIYFMAFEVEGYHIVKKIIVQ